MSWYKRFRGFLVCVLTTIVVCLYSIQENQGQGSRTLVDADLQMSYNVKATGGDIHRTLPQKVSYSAAHLDIASKDLGTETTSIYFLNGKAIDTGRKLFILNDTNHIQDDSFVGRDRSETYGKRDVKNSIDSRYNFTKKIHVQNNGQAHSQTEVRDQVRTGVQTHVRHDVTYHTSHHDHPATPTSQARISNLPRINPQGQRHKGRDHGVKGPQPKDTGMDRGGEGDLWADVSPGNRRGEGGNSLCKLPKSTPYSDSVVKNLFLSKPIANCDHQRRQDICTVSLLSEGMTKIRCRADLCYGNLTLGVLQAGGGLRWDKMATASHLETRIVRLTRRKQNLVKLDSWCFIRCEAFVGPGGGDTTITQLLLLPASVRRRDVPQKRRDATQTRRDVPHRRRETTQQTNPHPISISMIHLDSMSRGHFLRALPWSVATLKRLTANTSSSPVKVLDFELLQTIKARTFESLQVLFTGQLPEYVDLMADPGNPDEVPSNSSIAFELLFEQLKGAGYATLYSEDMCWESGWGLVRYLGVDPASPNAWADFMTALDRSYIDDYGISLSSCEQLRLNGVIHPFHGPPAVCLNGQYQHQYSLTYLRQYQQAMAMLHRPYFSFFASDVAHEPTGLRARTLDAGMSNYLESAARLDDVLTIVTADHGLAYGDFVQDTLQGRVEMFNPILYMILPDGVTKSLDPEWLNALEVNQQRLVTFLDIHLFLRDLIKVVTGKAHPIQDTPETHGTDPTYQGSEGTHGTDPTYQGSEGTHGTKTPYQGSEGTHGTKTPYQGSEGTHGTKTPYQDGKWTHGLHIPVPSSTSCNDIPTLIDTTCICDAHLTRAAPQPLYVLLATFGIEQVNSLIQRQKTESIRAVIPTYSTGCVPLALHRLLDIWVSHHQGMRSVKMNVEILPRHLMVKTGNGNNINSSNYNINVPPETWTLTVQWGPGSSTPNMTLTSFTRLAQYGHYRACADPGVDLKFCLCALSGGPSQKQTSLSQGQWASRKPTLHQNDTTLMRNPQVSSQSQGELLLRTSNETSTSPRHVATPQTSSNLLSSNNDRNDNEDLLKDVKGRDTSPTVSQDGDNEFSVNRTSAQDGFYLGRPELGVIAGRPEKDCLRLVVSRNSMGAAFWVRNECTVLRRLAFSLSVTNMDVSLSQAVSNQVVPAGHCSFVAIAAQSRPNMDFSWKYKARSVD